jgi:hypothetical protein
MMKLRAKYIQENLLNIQFRTINIMSASHNTKEGNFLNHICFNIQNLFNFSTSIFTVSYDSQNELLQQH